MTLTILAVIFVAILSLNYDGPKGNTPREILMEQGVKEAKERERLADLERRQNSRARALAAAQQFSSAFKTQPNNTGIKP